MSTIAAATGEEAPNQSPEIIQDNYHKMSRAELLSKLISQELDLMTSKDVSPQAAKDRIDQLCVQINQARTKFNKLQTRNTPSSSSSSAIAAGNGDPELERDLQLLNKENSIMKKSLLVRWADVSAAGDQGSQLIHDLIAKGLIHPVYKDTLTVGGYWMHPFVRSTLSEQNCLQLEDSRDMVYVTDNSSEDIFYDDPTPFLTKRKLRILHLGNWQLSSVRHIEVEDPKSFFKDMAKLSDLRYVSLRGVSLVTELPQFITKLRLLQTLDLKSCHNLEVLPSSIGNLASSLTHLDMSECYFLEDMPMALSQLHSLRVLKGFVVREDIKENSCSLRDLISLKNLRKLNIYTHVRSFPHWDEQETLKLFSSLRSLTISWGGCSLPRKETGDSGLTATTYAIEHQRHHKEKKTSFFSSTEFYLESPGVLDKQCVPGGLDKLDLQCVPETVTHDWLHPDNFRNLKKALH